jgi:hypothetical protein
MLLLDIQACHETRREWNNKRTVGHIPADQFDCIFRDGGDLETGIQFLNGRYQFIKTKISALTHMLNFSVVIRYIYFAESSWGGQQTARYGCENTEMKTIVYLIRHGAYENPLNILHGRLPGFRYQRGKRQAKLRTFENKTITAIYSSRLTRLSNGEILLKKFRKRSKVTDGSWISFSFTEAHRIYKKYSFGLSTQYIRAGGNALMMFCSHGQVYPHNGKDYAGKQFVVVPR